MKSGNTLLISLFPGPTAFFRRVETGIFYAVDTAVKRRKHSPAGGQRNF